MHLFLQGSHVYYQPKLSPKTLNRGLTLAFDRSLPTLP